MAHLSIRDLQKMSREKIAALRGPTPVKVGAETVGILTPIKKVDLERLETALRMAEELRAKRDPEVQRALLAQFEDVDPTDWSEEAVEAVLKDWATRR
jgi:hypothetical protein